MDCIFCKIINKEIPCYKIYEDELSLVFLDINPNSCGHLLIIPKEHYVCLEDINEDLLAHIGLVSKKMYKLLNEKLPCVGIKATQNNGVLQDVKHYHLHMIPHYKKDLDLSVEEVYNLLIK